MWIQPDGATMPYVFMDESVEISIEVRRLGNAQLGKSAPVTLEVVHPIGYVMQTWSWNTSELIGSIGSDTNSVEWTPDVAHSILNTSTNELHGGLILRASVDYPQDDRNENDLKEQAVPVAIQSDKMDGNLGTSLGFIPGRYQVNGGGAIGQGSWTTAGTDENNSDVGSKHWRHSQPGRTTHPALTTGSSAVSSRPRRTVDQALRSTVNSPTCTRFTRAATPSTRTISSQRSSMSARGVRPTTVTPSPSRCGAHPANTTTPCSRSTGT